MSIDTDVEHTGETDMSDQELLPGQAAKLKQRKVNHAKSSADTRRG
jgi:hypothetical protein